MSDWQVFKVLIVVVFAYSLGYLLGYFNGKSAVYAERWRTRDKGDRNG